jgi:putative ABC transport system permease protein
VLKGLDATTIQVKLLGPGRTSVSTGTPVNGYWSVGQVDYQPATAGALTARQVVNPPSVWFTGHVDQAAMDDEDSQYRTVTSHVKVTAQSTSPGGSPAALIKVAGVFDPARIKSFDPLSRVPLGAYSPLTVAPATAASRQALHSGDLLPNQNVGGLVSQPVNLITTLSALPTLENSGVYTGVHAADPISVIRVRVAGVTRPDALSRERASRLRGCWWTLGVPGQKMTRTARGRLIRPSVRNRRYRGWFTGAVRKGDNDGVKGCRIGPPCPGLPGPAWPDSAE